MMRSFIGAALALALAATHAEAAARPHKAAPRRAAPVGVSIGRSPVSGLPRASLGRRFGAVLPTGDCNPHFVNGQVPPPATWNTAFNCAFPKAGGTLQGPLGLQASSTATAPLSIPPGSTPTTPSDGDVWATNSGLFVRYGGSTVGPLGAGGGGGSNASFLASGNYVNVPNVTTSANQSLSAFVGPNALLKNYGSTQIIYHSSGSATSVTVATADGVIEPGGTQEIALGTNANIAFASVVSGAISGTGSVQVIDGSGLWTGSGGGSSGGIGSSVAITGPLGTQTISAAVAVTPATSSSWSVTGAVTANAGTNLNTSALALETGGNLAGIKTNQNVTTAGTSATSAQSVQGVNGGVAVTVQCPGGGVTCFGGSVGANVTVVGVPADATGVGSSPIQAADAASTSSTGFGGQVIWAGSPTANSAETFSLNTYQGILASCRGTFTSTTTLVAEQTLDAASAQSAGTAKWTSALFTVPSQTAGNAPQASTFTAVFENAALNVGGLQGIRFRVLAGHYTSSDSITCSVRTTLTGPAGAVQGIASAQPFQVVSTVIQSNSSIPINISTATTQTLVAAVSGKAIYVTSWDAISGGITNLTFEYGTGSACVGGTTALTGPYGLVAQFGAAKGSGLGPVLVVPAGNALCAVNSAGVQVSGSLSFIQQ